MAGGIILVLLAYCSIKPRQAVLYVELYEVSGATHGLNDCRRGDTSKTDKQWPSATPIMVKYWRIVGVMLCQRLGRWHNITPTII